MGSKNAIVADVCEVFPPATHFYDLFCGGCSITHFLMLRHRFQQFHINDITDTPTLFADAVNGLYNNETRWISRADFFALKDTDPYVRYCWSFGNNGEDYMYSREVEPWKRALHYAYVFGDDEPMREFGITDEPLTYRKIKHNEAKYKELYINWYRRCGAPPGAHADNLETMESLQSLQSLQRLQRLQRLQSLQSLQSTIGDYQAVPIEPDSIIYCDIPYRGTAEYVDGGFDYERFYDWACRQSVPVFISEYQMPDDRFVCIKEIQKRCCLAATNNSLKTTERIFIPKGQKIYHPQQLSLF